jgi:hypothetical protein
MLKGMDLLWRIFLQSNDIISIKACEFLIDLHTKIHIKSESRRE